MSRVSRIITAINKGKIDRFIKPFISRSSVDGGSISYNKQLQKLFNMDESLRSFDLITISSFAGAKTRVSGSNTFASKLYDLGRSKNDASQSTATFQPHYKTTSPGESISLNCPNGTTPYLTHNTIQFSNTDRWTIELMLQYNGSSDCVILGEKETPSNTNAIFLQGSSYGGGFRFNNNLVSGATFTYSQPIPGLFIGRVATIHLVATGSSISLYVDGNFINTQAVDTSFKVNSVLKGITADAFNLAGRLYHYKIFSKDLSAFQIKYRSVLLRQLIDNFDVVQIDGQRWALKNCELAYTPQMNQVREIQLIQNTDRITNSADGQFTSDTGFWTKSAAVTISGGVANVTAGTGTFLYRNSAVNTLGIYVKVSYTITVTSGNIAVKSGSNGIVRSTSGTYSEYIQVLDPTRAIGFTDGGSAFTGTIDNVQFYEVGWSDAKNLYDAIYAATAGTVEQKTYAGVKAACMWAHYNNDSLNGAIYGKLYNWYAVKLIQMDIDYYNAAYPSNPFPWRVSTQAEHTALSTFLGGDSPAGRSLKLAGTEYWNATNDADNSTRFSALPGGTRLEDGSYSQINQYGNTWGITELDQDSAYIMAFQNISSSMTRISSLKLRGRSLRFIK